MKNENDNLDATDPWMDTATFCQYVGGIREQTAAAWRCYGRGPAFTRIGRKIRYRKSVVDAWLASRTGLSTTALDVALTT